MLFLKEASIKKRLTSIIMLTSGISVLLTTLTISVIGVYTLKHDLLRDLSATASIVGDRNTAALLFNDDTLAESNMKVFSARRSITEACLYDKNGDIFAIYTRNERQVTSCPPPLGESQVIKDKTVHVIKHIERTGDIIGSMYIQSDLQEIHNYVHKQAYIAFAVTLAVLAISYILAVNLQHAISGPVLSLAATAREVSRNKDYTIRAAPYGGKSGGRSNEIMVLTDSFNSMMEEIGERDFQLKQQNIELEKAKEAAETASRAKSQFLANISHELRTPLNAIIGFSSIIMNQLFGKVEEKYIEYAADINESGTHLLDIINDILDLAKAEAGSLVLAFEEVQLAKAVNKCLSIMAEKARLGEVTVTSEVAPNLPPLVADRLRLIQILLNVLSNAIKFTPKGGRVHLHGFGQEIDGEVTHIIVTVSDTGIGMCREDIDKAFQSFGQVDSGLNRKYEGTGLGLPITRMLLELHHGTIEIDSEPGRGTLVTMSLPVLPPGADTEEASPE